MDVGTQDSPGADRPNHAKTRRVGRRRVILAVVCLVMGALVGVAGVVSGWRSFGYEGNRVAIEGLGGALSIFVRVEGSFGNSGWGLSPSDSTFSWNGWMKFFRIQGWFRHDWGVVGIVDTSVGDPNTWGILISLWFLVTVFLLTGTGLAFSAWRSIHRARVDSCAKCHYDLRGLSASAPCPECGKVRVVGVASLSQQ